MRGLDIRADYARANIRRITDLDAAWDMFNEVVNGAYQQGQKDYLDRIFTVPAMFADVTELVSAWEQGQYSMEILEETDDCAGCQNDLGNPCHIHG